MPAPYTAFTLGDPTVNSAWLGIGLPAPVWLGWTLGNGTVGVAYSQQMDLAPAASVTVSVASGSLPTGLSLSRVSGSIWLLSGTPTVASTYTFTLLAANAYGSDSKSFSIVVGAAGSGGGSFTFAM